MEPTSLQIASKINLQIDHLMDSVSDHSWDRFGPILVPNLEPKTAQDQISWSQDAPKTPQIGAKIIKHEVLEAPCLKGGSQAASRATRDRF